MKHVAIVLLLSLSGTLRAEQPFSPYNQQFTYNQNQQYGSTNWYSSPLGMGAAQVGETLIGGLVNAMSRPDPVIYLQPQSAPVTIQGHSQSYAPATVSAQSAGNCAMQTLYDRQGQPRYVKVCD